ncbi:type II toxin-antitoxin system RelE/ParE family toxin [Maricaulis sp.]|uniref:type II toxin-antitoxin system RelE/ParE family toxin n=1 Tax=Maricaulis sp. TaxID=1486257 RepID=UPI001B08DE17|nr:type II toxin-antitoxin system RelE/ParE family toxin [Maricaulis sp.]MBO6765415.1 type II toxin-antitoxin system RelE/ParE family toxin [Maricaulis sp.]
MKLALSKRARADYKAIRAYSLKQFGLQQAAAYRERFETAFERLLAFPESGAPSDTVASGLRRLPVGRHCVFYPLTAGEVRIVAILHQRQLPDDV